MSIEGAERNFRLISDWPDEEKFTEVRSPLLSLRGVAEALRLRRRDAVDSDGRVWQDDRLSLPPLYDRGGPTSIYRGPSGPIGKLARLEINRLKGRPLDEGLGDEPFIKSEV